jgi:transposase
VTDGMGWVGPMNAARVGARVVLDERREGKEGGRMSIVMGLDRRRARITAEWVDTATGEIARSRVRPADRAGVRRFLGRFHGQRLEAALEATTGWRFVVRELRAIGAEVHLAEPAETAARRGQKKRPKTDRADARHLREPLLVDRPPESWIPPDHILDPRAGVRLRHTLVDRRGEWQQRIQAVLYHHRCPHHHGIGLLPAKGRAWLEGLGLPPTALERVTVAPRMIDMLDVQLAPIDKELRAYARRQPGCRALMSHYGIGHPTAVTILAELGDAGRFSSSRDAVRYAGLDITVKQSDRRRAPGHLSRQGPPASRGRPTRPPSRPAATAAPTATTTPGRPSGSAATAPASRSRPSRSSAATTPRASSATSRCNRPDAPPLARAALTQTDAPRPAPGIVLPPRPPGRPPTTERPHSFTQRDHPTNHHVADPPHGRAEVRDTAGRPRTTPTPSNAHTPPDRPQKPRPSP